MKDTDDPNIILHITHLKPSNHESITVIPAMILSSQVHHMTKCYTYLKKFQGTMHRMQA